MFASDRGLAHRIGLSRFSRGPEMTKQSGDCAEGLQPAARFPEGSFETAAQHLRMRDALGRGVALTAQAGSARRVITPQPYGLIRPCGSLQAVV